VTLWCALGFALVCRAAVKGLGESERRLVLTLFVVAALLRVLVVAVLFLATDHDVTPFGSLFGDEEYFKRRSLWLRSIALDVDISIADRIYALDEYSDTSYLYWLAFLQVLVGPAPYGVHVLSILLYLAAAAIFYRFNRATFGELVALLTLALVLFLPSLFMWSVSALRESVHFLITIGAMVASIQAWQERGWRRVTYGGVALIAVWLLRDLRAGSMAVVAASIALGLVIAAVSRYRHGLAVGMLVSAIVAGGLLARPATRDQLLAHMRAFASNHQGHVYTPGLHYKLLPPEYYVARTEETMQRMDWPDATRFALRALAAFLVVPLPWQAQSRLTLAYLPEQAVWYVLVLLTPIGVWVGWRQHRAATLVLATYVVLMSCGIAIRSGNIGTLIRHRGLVLPVVICLSAVAVRHLAARRASAAPHERVVTGRVSERMV
jgi:hypothetical protein